MGRIDIHLHLQNEKGLMEVSSTVMEMMPHLEELGIDHGVLMSISKDWNEHNLKSVQKYPEKYSWMCHVELDDDIEGQILRHKANGAVGVGEITHNLWIENEKIQQLFAAAEKHNMPVLFHMSGEEGFSYGICDKPGLTMLEESLKKFPNLKFIGHSQTFWAEMDGNVTEDERGGYPKGKIEEEGAIAKLMRKYPNLYGDVSAGSGWNALARDEEYAVKFINEFQDRLMFGTDICRPDTATPLVDFMLKLRDEKKISETVFQKVARENIIRILDL